jgi:hypothetical protein
LEDTRYIRFSTTLGLLCSKGIWTNCCHTLQRCLELQAKHEIVVVPTVVIYKDGEEMKRYQADISFSMKATRREMQDYIDELLMSDF